MNIQIELTSTSRTGETTYKNFVVLIETKKINIRVATGSKNPNYDYVEVMINSAIQKAYRSVCGKMFKNFDEALNNYKDKKIVAAIQAAQELIKFSNAPATAQA